MFLWRKPFSLTKNFCLWQNKFCDKNFFGHINFFLLLWPKYVSLMKTWTETCFCDENLYPEGFFFSSRIFRLTETCFCEINFFSVTVSCFCAQTLFCEKYYFWAFYMWFIGTNFCEKWKFPLSWIPKIATLWGPVLGLPVPLGPYINTF